MGDIGEPLREVTFEPIEEPVPAGTPVPEQAPAEQPDLVPA